MRITVSLDTQAVITQPSPLRIKAASFVPVEIAFTRGSQPVSLPAETVLEFALKMNNQWTGGLLAYSDLFACAAGHLYTGTLNCATESMLGALGLSDSTPANDIPQIEANGEVTWSVDGQKFRSATFAVTVEAPVTDESPVAAPDPELYPTPAQIARRSELPIFATHEQAVAGNLANVMMSPLAVADWFHAKLPGSDALALLGNGSWGLPDLSNYAGAIAGDGTQLTGVTALQVVGPSGGHGIRDTGSGNWLVDGGIRTGWVNASFTGDGSNLRNVTAYQVSSPGGFTIRDSGSGHWQADGGLSADWLAGDGSGLQNVHAVYAQNAYADEFGNSIANVYAQQWGYYGSMSVGYAEWTNNASYANYTSNADWANYSSYAYNDPWGCPLYGAGNIQWNFFGGSPSPGDVAMFDGNSWTPAPGTPVPSTAANAIERFALGGLRTGWLVKQLDNRTVYQVLDPNDCATELGWVPVGPFILVPVNSAPLVIDNVSPLLGDVIHCTAGTWSDNPASYAYQWWRNGNPISGATALAYTVVAADDGVALRCVVSASNSAGTGTAEAVIPTVVLTPPVNTAAPGVAPSGTPNVGDTLSLTGGTWTGYGYTTVYQWKRGGTAIAGATAATYTLAPSDAGQTISCTVTRTNIRGSATVTTAATPAVTNLIAVNTAIPTLSNTRPFTGLVLTCSPGTWSYHPTSYGYQWRRGGVAISGATSSTYTVVAGDVGSTLSCAVTATNAAGSSGAVASAESSAVTVAAPSPIQGSLASGLIARWSLDEASGTRMEASGNGMNLVPYANGGAITTAAGKFGMAANVPALSYLSVTDSRILGTKTICGWFNLTAVNSSYQRMIPNPGLIIFPDRTVTWDPRHVSTGVVPQPGQWHFFCIMNTGTAIKLWVNNQSFVVENIAAGTPLIGSPEFRLGDSMHVSVPMLYEEVACWNRVLSDAEIATLAAA